MITPEDILNIDTKNVSIDEIESRINASILRNHGDNEYEQGHIADAIPITIANAIAMRYIKAGWNYVYYNIDRKFNCTSFILSLIDKDYYSVEFKRYTKLYINDVGVNRQ